MTRINGKATMTEAFSVLLCEQDALQVERLRGVLNRAGHDVRAAPDVVSAQMQARKEPPNIVAVDVMLPGGGGAALLSRLRGNVHTAYIPAVGLINQTGETQALLDSGARECVTKPVDSEALITVIDRILDRPLIVDRAPKELIEDPRRLEVLDATNLLDSPREMMFDRLTSLASTLLPAPTALVSLVDRDRQYFKSQLGVGEPWATAAETPLTHSFCQWAVASREPLIVADARSHPLLRDNRAVDELGVTAYAGIPIVVHDQALGAMCAIDALPRTWSDREVASLEILAQICSAEILYGLAHEAVDRVDAFQAVSAGITGAGKLLGQAITMIGTHETRLIIEILDTFYERLQQLAAEPTVAVLTNA